MRNVGGFKLTMWGNKLACDPYCRLDGVGGASSWCPQCRDVAQHWLLSSNNIPPCPLNSKQCKKYCDTVSEHSFEKCVICLKVEQDLAAQIQYFLCPNGPERYLIDQQIFCIFLHKSKSCTRIGPRNVHREIWRWKQEWVPQNCDICICGNFYLIPSLGARPQYLSGRGTVTIRGSEVGVGWLHCNVALFSSRPCRRCNPPQLHLLQLKASYSGWGWAWSSPESSRFVPFLHRPSCGKAMSINGKGCLSLHHTSP